MVKIRLKRAGAKKRPYYRVIAIDHREKRDGRALEYLGTYDPMSEPALSRIARFVAEAPVNADSETMAVLRNGVIDTLGCIHAGVGSAVARKARDSVRAMGATGMSPVLGTDMLTSRPLAAFLNAVAGHAMDFDDWEIPGNSHTTVIMLPALLAAAFRAQGANAFWAGDFTSSRALVEQGIAVYDPEHSQVPGLDPGVIQRAHDSITEFTEQIEVRRIDVLRDRIEMVSLVDLRSAEVTELLKRLRAGFPGIEVSVVDQQQLPSV